ncbi:protein DETOXIFICATION 42 [Physcomitrium patens]|uniref:Protein DETOXIFICATION n=1 Tax=Physcomitrium patens TaxID=3218 RepID=A0A2K1IIQ7_PHYPA|nr:protein DETOXIFICATION 42-like [Physcomitrium patens]XP_024362057.1 protein DETOXIFICATION 42-like [Physcomitrium patens]XP_024362058.1 protein DETOXIFICATION 42-like [Physcomitrium patens]XP_024362059.1 protein DETOXIFICATION 42-like [Physcomitrium patens]PNR29163.1 hypothetical protein PHYPA_027855 [Physcomitrium patens]|eukprot:XP_024362056.1 protein DETOXIFICATION 42-like [Physcomitrella patens]
MDNLLLNSIRCYSGHHEIRPVAWKERSNQCKPLHGLVGFSHQRNLCICKTISSSLLPKNIIDRQFKSSKYCTPNSIKHGIFSSKPLLQKQARIIRMEFRSDSGNDSKTTLTSETKTPGWSFFDDSSNMFKADDLGKDIVMIALPAVLALAADPIASLVDTAFIGQIGPVELAAVGVSISVFNLVSKVCNIPLLNVTTSFVAEDASEESSGVDDLTKFQESESTPLLSANRSQASKPRPVDISEEQKRFLPAISSALVLGIALGVGEAFILAFLAGPILNVMGVGVASPMHTPALEYLALRGLGAPAVVVALAIQGVFRGFKDTKTPLYASIAGSFVNVFLDPVLMFSLHLGVGGAAVATVVSEYFIASVLLWKLKQRVLLFPKRWEDLKFGRFLTSGGYLIGRTISLFAVFTLGTSMAARQGAIPMAAHQICVQIWLAVSLLSDSLALAGQAIIAGAFAKNDYKLVKEASIRVLQIGLGLGVVSGLALAIGMPTFTSVFTDDETVLFYVGLLIPFVVVTQPINALAFVFDGLHYGASDFEYAAVSMMAISVPSISVLLLFPNYWGISGVWAGLTTVMTLRMVAGFWRMKSTTGPWRFLNGETYETEDEL